MSLYAELIGGADTRAEIDSANPSYCPSQDVLNPSLYCARNP